MLALSQAVNEVEVHPHFHFKVNHEKDLDTIDQSPAFSFCGVLVALEYSGGKRAIMGRASAASRAICRCSGGNECYGRE